MTPTKKRYPTPMQKHLLIQLLEADPQLRSGKFSSTFTKKESETRWKWIADQINSLNGANKSWESWRKTWQDRKSNTKKKFAIARRQSNMTGGGPPPKPPSEEDMVVLSTMSSASLVGHSDCQESVVEFIDINMLNNSKTTATVGVAANANSVATATVGAAVSPNSVASVSPAVVTEETEEVTDTIECEIQPLGAMVEVRSTAQPMQGTHKRSMTRQQTMVRSLAAAENLNKTLEDKNAYKKVFYEQFIQLMQQQTEALNLIANTISTRNSPYI